jgi:hypothetical protein
MVLSEKLKKKAIKVSDSKLNQFYGCTAHCLFSPVFFYVKKFKQEADFTNNSTRIVDRVSGTVCCAVLRCAAQREAVTKTRLMDRW